MLNTPETLASLSNAELNRRLADCRITLESIRPYKCKDVSDEQAALRAELARRERKGPRVQLTPYGRNFIGTLNAGVSHD